jgi:hypothetical protein
MTIKWTEFLLNICIMQKETIFGDKQDMTSGNMLFSLFDL